MHPSRYLLKSVLHVPSNTTRALSSRPWTAIAESDLARKLSENSDVRAVSADDSKSSSTSLVPSDEEVWALIKAIATKTSLDSPRVFGPSGIGRPVIGDFPATIHPREHRWAGPQVTDPDKWLADVAKRHQIKSTTIAFLQNLPEKEISLRGLQLWGRKKSVELRRTDQAYDPERVRVLGPELAVAHFIAHRGGAVKFFGIDRWYSAKEGNLKSLPGRFVEKAKIEAIDASGMDLVYEGLENFIGLRHIKSLKLRNCKFIDDWCLPKLFILSSSLEHLDISGCPKITERGIASLYHLRNLKSLNISNLPKVENKEYVALLLEDELPLLEVSGVAYNNTAELPEPEQQKKLEEVWEKRRIPNPFQKALPGFVEVGNKRYAEAINAEFERQLNEFDPNILSGKKQLLKN